ncbi:hypothetical protein [Curvibacter sp. PAE-UM]|uniref:hypothetical protein n=1 Tax=Curvibacter sp. PAE-UM TaxID=1714344 RepID=UPI000A62A46C|nr:hypothetical protein [Curvibacter sp. PAE-UM]
MAPPLLFSLNGFRLLTMRDFAFWALTALSFFESKSRNTKYPSKKAGNFIDQSYKRHMTGCQTRAGDRQRGHARAEKKGSKVSPSSPCSAKRGYQA